MSEAASARDGALAKLAVEAARFAAGADPTARPTGAPGAASARAVAPLRPPSGAEEPPGYVPVAVAPERGNTRPVVPVDGRIHMRMAQATIDALDDVVASWKANDPAGLRDLERATLIRIAVAMALTDVARHGSRGAVGEAVRAALDPAVRHTDTAMPPLARWLTSTPASVVAQPSAGRPVGAASG